jgi:adenosylhomocysteine nucleosidase
MSISELGVHINRRCQGVNTNVAVLFALRRESMFFLRTLTGVRRLAGAPCQAWLCETNGISLLILETGIGRAKSRRALQWLTRPMPESSSPFRPDLIISAGFAGGLHPALTIGAVVQAHEVVDEEGSAWPVLTAFVDQPAHRLLTCRHLVARAEEKAILADRYQSQLVDMESAEVAHNCAEQDIPLVCLRGISDDDATELPPHLTSLLSNGQVALAPFAWTLLRRPSSIVHLWKLGKTTARAGKNLAMVLQQLLQQINSSRG